MKAAIKTSMFGYSLTFTSDYPIPKFHPTTANKNDVFVKVKAAGVNPLDYKVPKAFSGPVYGFDFCGTITAVGSKVEDFSVGEEVFGSCSHGTLAEYTVAKAIAIAKKPTHWKTTECAALPISYMGALQGLRAGGITPLREGEKRVEESALIIGASGGAGIAALQLCEAMDVPRVVAICSGKNSDVARDNGATEVVDYTNDEKLDNFFSGNKGKIDCVLDAATGSGGGENYWEKSIPLLKEGHGHYVALNGPGGKWAEKYLGLLKKRETLLVSETTTEDLETVTRLLDKTNVKPIVTAMPFTDEGVHNAYGMLKSRRTKGKIVIEL